MPAIREERAESWHDYDNRPRSDSHLVDPLDNSQPGPRHPPGDDPRTAARAARPVLVGLRDDPAAGVPGAVRSTAGRLARWAGRCRVGRERVAVVRAGDSGDDG